MVKAGWCMYSMTQGHRLLWYQTSWYKVLLHLISLGLSAFDNVSFEMQTMTSCKATMADLVKFNVQSLHIGEIFCNVVSVVSEPWSDDENTLPHK